MKTRTWNKKQTRSKKTERWYSFWNSPEKIFNFSTLLFPICKHPPKPSLGVKELNLNLHRRSSLETLQRQPTQRTRTIYLPPTKKPQGACWEGSGLRLRFLRWKSMDVPGGQEELLSTVEICQGSCRSRLPTRIILYIHDPPGWWIFEYNCYNNKFPRSWHVEVRVTIKTARYTEIGLQNGETLVTLKHEARIAS